MNAPVTTERKSFLPLRLRATTVFNSGNIPTTSRPTTPVAISMPLTTSNDTQSTLTVGNRVLVNGLKSGILRYIGSVQFAQGLFCGVELDQPDGKHDGQVNDVRYFQCKTNHGIFVPHDKVVLATRERTVTTQRSVGRLKPPMMTRSMTLTPSADKKPEQVRSKTPPTTMQLPDIIPNPSTATPSTPVIETVSDPIITDAYEQTTPTGNLKPILKPPPVVIDDPPEIIEADFTDSVSLILHQLQQEQKPSTHNRRHSITISEEGTIDDLDEDDDTDELDNESIAESNSSEKPPPPLDPVPPVNNPIKSIPITPKVNTPEKPTIIKNNLTNSKPFSYSNRSLASSTASVNQLKIIPIDKRTTVNQRKPILPTPAPVEKKVPERKLSVPLTVVPSTVRKSLLVTSNKGLSLSIRSVNLSGSQSKINQSPSSSNSVNSSRSDLTSNPTKSTKTISNTSRGPSRSMDLNSRKNSNATADALNHQLTIQQIRIRSLESTNEQLKKQYQHLLNRFDFLCILNQYSLDCTEQNQQEYQLKLSQIRTINCQLKTSMKELQTSHKQEFITLHDQYQNHLQTIKTNHKQESSKYQQEIEKLSNEKTTLDIRCASLQDQVDRFMEEMANSEYADPLLRHVETLEKDRTSLQTVLELRNQELTQLRTRIHEQVFQREDQLALQKRIDMAENRNQDLICLLRNWQLNEKAVVVERDQLKEQIALLERDNQQLTFERETLLYSLRQRSTTIAYIPTSNPRPNEHRRVRARSFSCLLTTRTENERLKRSSSVNFL